MQVCFCLKKHFECRKVWNNFVRQIESPERRRHLKETLTVFNIQRYSLHDGEGIRTVIFLKGCPLRCRWCCNPESQNPKPEMMFRRSLCMGQDICGRCLQYKAEEAQSVVMQSAGDGIPTPVWPQYSACLSCEKICPAKAMEVVGKEWEVSDLLKEVQKDEAFYIEGGGVTLSGGEPLLQEASLELLRRAKEAYLNTSIETCGAVPFERLAAASVYLDHIFMDIKSTNPQKHLLFTGDDGSRIRDNLRRLTEIYPPEKITVRTPVIPGFNDTSAELDAIRSFLQQLPEVKQVEDITETKHSRNVLKGTIAWQRLSYHEYGKGKYEMLGREYLL